MVETYTQVHLYLIKEPLSRGKTRVHMSLATRRPVFCICENKDADQLRGNREADQRLCFRYIDSTIPLLPKSQNFKPLANFCDYTAQFVSDLVGNPEDRFSQNEAHILYQPSKTHSLISTFVVLVDSILPLNFLDQAVIYLHPPSKPYQQPEICLSILYP